MRSASASRSCRRDQEPAYAPRSGPRTAPGASGQGTRRPARSWGAVEGLVMLDVTGHGTDPRTPAPASVSRVLLEAAAAIAVLEQRVAALEERARQAPSSAPEAEWVSPSVAATVAGVSPATLRRWRAQGLLAVGRRRRVNVRELRRLMAGEGGPPPVADLASARARRAAARVKGGPSR